MFKDVNDFYFLYGKLNKSKNTHKCYDNKSEKNRRAKYFLRILLEILLKVIILKV